MTIERLGGFSPPVWEEPLYSGEHFLACGRVDAVASNVIAPATPAGGTDVASVQDSSQPAMAPLHIVRMRRDGSKYDYDESQMVGKIAERNAFLQKTTKANESEIDTARRLAPGQDLSLCYYEDPEQSGKRIPYEVCLTASYGGCGIHAALGKKNNQGVYQYPSQTPDLSQGEMGELSCQNALYLAKSAFFDAFLNKIQLDDASGVIHINDLVLRKTYFDCILESLKTQQGIAQDRDRGCVNNTCGLYDSDEGQKIFKQWLKIEQEGGSIEQLDESRAELFFRWSVLDNYMHESCASPSHFLSDNEMHWVARVERVRLQIVRLSSDEQQTLEPVSFSFNEDQNSWPRVLVYFDSKKMHFSACRPKQSTASSNAMVVPPPPSNDDGFSLPAAAQHQSLQPPPVVDSASLSYDEGFHHSDRWRARSGISSSTLFSEIPRHVPRQRTLLRQPGVPPVRAIPSVPEGVSLDSTSLHDLKKEEEVSKESRSNGASFSFIGLIWSVLKGLYDWICRFLCFHHMQPPTETVIE